jgi:hypothetical protein
MANPIKSFKNSLGQIPTRYRYWTSLGILAALLIALPVTLIGLMTGTFELRKMATGEMTPIPTSISMLAGCRESCGDDQDCQEGLLCGTPCPPGQVCLEELFCYNPTCPYDQDCTCGGTPTTIPCTPEGQTMTVYPGYECCPGLEAISPNKPDANGDCPEYPLLGASVCVKDCGDGQCTLGENKCNCPEDCVHNSLKIKLRFGGVTSRPLDDSNKEVQIYATNLTGGPNLGSATDKKLITLEVDDSGVYHGEITPTSNYFGHRYRLRIKGPKHLQSVFPDEFFQAGGELDLTSSPLRPGDLDQDGDVDINDLRAIKVFSTNPADIALGDVNFDGKLSVFDRGLILITLSVQYDPD